MSDLIMGIIGYGLAIVCLLGACGAICHRDREMAGYGLLYGFILAVLTHIILH